MAEKLLCISKEIWEKILEVVERAGPGGGVEVPEVLDLEALVEGEDEQLETIHGCLQISQSRLAWWERENWKGVWDEARGWDDLSREGQRKLTKLMGRSTIDMDT